MDDLLEIGRRIEIEPHLDPEPRAHRWREHTESSRGANERELLDRHDDRLRLRPFGKTDVDPIILHRRIEKLFDDRPQAMDLIDEEDIALTQIGERSNEIARLLERRSGRVSYVDAQLARNELGESGLAQSGRAEEKCVVERLSARERRIYIDAQRFLHAILSDEFGQALRPQRELDYALVRNDLRCCYLGAGHWRLICRRKR